MEAKPRLRLRRLRIAWSVMWGFAGLLLVAFWGHTLHYQVRVEGWVSPSHFARFTTFKHWIGVEGTSYEIKNGNWYPSKTFQDNPVAPNQEKIAGPARRWSLSHLTASGQSTISTTIPIWFLELLA